MTYNAIVVDWICCPDCGCNIVRAEGLYENGDPRGTIECVCCGFSAADVRLHAGFADWVTVCERVGHEWMWLGETFDGRSMKACMFCGKQVFE